MWVENEGKEGFPWEIGLQLTKGRSVGARFKKKREIYKMGANYNSVYVLYWKYSLAVLWL